ncbi:UNVERIFIED_ORG: CMP-N-acetylneuraminic acid synthetase [Buttiauxella agrestis ATCC 33320]
MTLTVAVIPARGGSKRLPGKNIKLLAGKPMIAWTIEAALQSNIFDKIIVSTDCTEIQKIAMKYGAEVPFLRGKKLSRDTSTTSDVVIDLVEWLEKENEVVETIAILQPTSPLRTAQHIIDAFSLKNEKAASAIVSVCKLEHSIEICNLLPSDHSMKGFIPPENYKRSQEHKTYYRINGGIYIIDRHLICDFNNLYTEKSFAYIMDAKDSVDIDEQIDFDFADYLLRIKSASQNV